MLYSYHSSPAWSMPGRSKPGKRQHSPSPTTYFEAKQANHTTPLWKIGTSGRGKLSFLEEGNPGPGTYSVKRNNSSGVKFTRSGRKIEMDNEVPGPGAYTLESGKKLKRGYYMAKKYKAIENKQNPGPGEYDGAYSSTLRKDFGKMGNARRLVYKVSDVPGPGSYQAERCQSAGPRISFSKQKRMKLKIFNNNIGPGKYEIQPTIKTDPNKGYSICGRYEVPQKSTTPGPATYNPKDVAKSNHRSIVIGERFESQHRPKTPGPGSYLFESRTSFINDVRYGAFGKDSRKSLMDLRETPGPAAYTVHLKPNMPASPKYSLKGGRQNNQTQNVPGPGEYDPNYQTIKMRPVSAKIGSSIRKNPKFELSPGPGEYNLKDTTEGPFWGFGTSGKASMDLSETPAPNHYNLKSTISDVPPYVLTSTN